METYGAERMRALESSPTRFLIATAIAVPLILVAIQAVHVFSDYRESTWYRGMAQWFTCQAEDARQVAEKYGRWASEAKSPAESTNWKAKVSEQIALAERYEKQAQLCMERAENWSKNWFSGWSRSGSRKDVLPSPVNSSLTAIGLPGGR